MKAQEMPKNCNLNQSTFSEMVDKVGALYLVSGGKWQIQDPRLLFNLQPRSFLVLEP